MDASHEAPWTLVCFCFCFFLKSILYLDSPLLAPNFLTGLRSMGFVRGGLIGKNQGEEGSKYLRLLWVRC